MESIALPDDFADFLRLLTDHEVEFLLVGGFAVAIHGYARATADMDVWIERSNANAERVNAAIAEFGFDVPALDPSTFLQPDRVVRMGVAPMRIEVLTDIDGVEFVQCMGRAERVLIGDLAIPVISIADLKANKRASGRPKDLADLENLP